MGISVNPYLMILVFVCFLILLVCLNQWLYKPVFEFMDKRDEHIKKDLQDTQNNAQDILTIEEEINAIISKAQQEAKDIIEQANIEEKDLFESAIQQKKAELDDRFMKFREQSKNDQKELRTELLTHIDEYKQAIAHKLKIL